MSLVSAPRLITTEKSRQKLLRNTTLIMGELIIRALERAAGDDWLAAVHTIATQV
jgi:hypothetical protein